MTQLDRIEERLQAVDDRTRAMEIRMGEITGEERAHHWAGSILRHALPGLLGFVSGVFGGHLPPLGGH